MTTYNRAKFIKEAIESVISSNYKNWELIIVDDHSSDNTSEIVKPYLKDKRIYYYRNETNLGQFANRNKAASLAKGKYIKYLDSDDIIYSYGLDVLVDGLEQYPIASIAIASQDTHPTEFRYPQLITSQEAYRAYFYNDALLTIGPSGTMFKRESFNKTGGYSGNNATADTELMLKIAAIYPVVRIQPNFFYYRIHNEQVLDKSCKIKTYAIEAYKNGMNALKNSHCPLTNYEKKRAIKILKKRIIKVGLYQILRKGKLKLGTEILKPLFDIE